MPNIWQQLQCGCVVVFNLVTSYLNAPLRHFEFMLKGLQEVETALKALDIPFYMLCGDPTTNIPAFVCAYKAKAILCDYSPLLLGRQWKETVCDAVDCPVYEVD